MARLWARMDDDVDLVNGYKISRSDPFHRIVIGRVYHHTVKLLFGLRVRDVDCDFRLMRRSIFERVHAREEQRRDLPGDDEEDHRRRLPHRRGAGAPLPPRLRQVAVLQLPPHLPHRRRRAEAVVGAGRPPRPSARAGGAPARARPRHASRAGGPAARRAHDGRLPRLLSRPPRDDHRRPRLHRQQPGAAAGRPRRRRPARRLAHPRLRRQPVQRRRHRATASASTSPTSGSRRR